MSRTARLILAFCLFSPVTGWALEMSDIPTEPPRDEIMPAPQQVQDVLDWAGLAFTGRRAGAEPAVRVEVRRQDHNVLRFGQSCMETPIKIGQREFAHGLGTHANSEIVLHVPRRRQGVRGLRRHRQQSRHRRRARLRPVQRGDRRRQSVPDARAQGRPGPGRGSRRSAGRDARDHAQGGCHAGRSGLRPGRLGRRQDRHGRWEPPLGGRRPPVVSHARDAVLFRLRRRVVRRTAEELDPLDRNKRRARPRRPHGVLDRRQDRLANDRPGHGVQALRRGRVGAAPSRTQGTQDTPILENIQALDVQLRTGYSRKPAVLHQLTGDVCGERSFLPLETELEAGKPVAFAPTGGRPSNGAFPFFNLQLRRRGPDHRHRLVGPVGGAAWNAPTPGPRICRRAWRRRTCTLHPGEKIRSPRILLMPWKGDRLDGAQPLPPPAAVRIRAAARTAGRCGCRSRCSASTATVGTCPSGARKPASSARLKRRMTWAATPTGSTPPGSRADSPTASATGSASPGVSPTASSRSATPATSSGLKFMLWFEPERVAPGTQIAREHPEFVFGGDKGRPLQAERSGRPPLADGPAVAAASTSSAWTSIATTSTSTRSASGGRPTRPTARA